MQGFSLASAPVQEAGLIGAALNELDSMMQSRYRQPPRRGQWLPVSPPFKVYSNSIFIHNPCLQEESELWPAHLSHLAVVENFCITHEMKCLFYQMKEHV